MHRLRISDGQNGVGGGKKEIKTYAALSLFLSRKRTLESMNARDKQALLHPAFYKERMKEAKKLVTELKKSN
jgi:hypothetical protein